MPLLKIAYDAFKDVEERMRHISQGKGERRSNRAAMQADRGPLAALCPLRHDQIAHSGPPFDHMLRYVCIHCGAYADEARIKERGYDFNTVPDYIMHEIMDAMLKERRDRG